MKRQIKYILYVMVMIFLSSIFVNICMNKIDLFNFSQHYYEIKETEQNFYQDNNYNTKKEYNFEHPVYRGEPYEIINPVYRGEPIEFQFLKY